MQNERPLNIPVLLGTIRKGRASAHVARFLLEQVREREGVVTGLLKHVLDSNLMEYVHKAVGIAGVSAGPFGGTRVIQNCLAPMRELGFVTIFFDVNFSNVLKLFDESGNLLDASFVRRTEKFLNELIWMAATLRYGRENIPLK